MFPFPSMQCAGRGAPFWTWNPADKDAGVTLSSTLRTMSVASLFSASAVRGTRSKAAGRWYFEAEMQQSGNATMLGIGTAAASLTQQLGREAASWGLRYDGTVVNNVADQGTSAALSDGDIVGVALDLTSLLLHFAVNNSWRFSSNPSAGSGGFAIASATWLW